MDVITLIGISIGLSMDAFAVALCTGLGGVSARQTFRMAFYFGFFQFFMPILGWFAGNTIEEWIAPFDHYVAFGLLAFVGGRMVFSGLHEREGPRVDPTRGWTLLLLSIATSIDALAVGLGIGLLGEAIMIPAVVIGIVCATLTAIGLRFGRVVGRWLGEKVEVIGGVVLIAIGTKILIEHLMG